MNLEKNSSSQNYISKLRVTQNDRHIEINSQTEIEKEIFRFYRDLYDEKETKNDSIDHTPTIPLYTSKYTPTT